MTPFLQLALALAILIAAAKTGGYLSSRLGQPSVLGELLVGLLLGPSVVDIFNIPYFSDPHLPEVIHHLAEIGVLLLMFLAGLELDLRDLARSGKVSALAGSFGVFFPIVLGAAAGLMFSMPVKESLFIGLMLAATSVSISAQVLMEMGVLRSRVGIGLLGAAVFDDILVVLGLSIFTALTVSEGSSGWLQVGVVVLRMAGFMTVAFVLGNLLLPRATRRVSTLPISRGLIAFTLVLILGYGWAAEELGGMAAITGSFLAGLVLARSPEKERIEAGVATLAYSLFVPIFFINVGLIADMRSLLGGNFLLFVVMTLVAIISKVAGCGLGALMSGLSRRESLQIGLGMMSRGEVGLIVAAVGIAQQIIDAAIFSTIVGVVILTTLLTPPLLRKSFQNTAAKSGGAPSQPSAKAQMQTEINNKGEHS